ncbi:hypothetical protein [Enterobacter asburiae]|uniref:hypothetical protein n=1 Tax=Enterobacter asburiae TaxID=61645 RepID=UPI002156411B|nr:hypothetical protein [Enterobacter asburiae]
MSVKSFDISGEHCEVFGDNNGEYCLYEDCAALEARCAELAAENAGLKQAITTHSQSTHFCEVCGKDDPCSTDDVCYVLNETPATDAFLAEVRASGVEMFASNLKVLGPHEHPYSRAAKEFYAQLRQGAVL